MNIPVREGETIEGSRTMRNRPYPVLSSAQVLRQKSTWMNLDFCGPDPDVPKLRCGYMLSLKRSRAAAAASPPAAPILLSGGHHQQPDVVQKFRAGERCDVKLKSSDGPAIPAHAIILVGASKYFKTWSGTWADGNGAEPHGIPFSSACLRACLEYVYAGEAEVVDETALVEVLEGADFLQMDGLLEAAAKACGKRLSASNAIAVWQVADRIGRLPWLAEAAAKAARDEFHEIVVLGGESWAAAPAWIVRSLLEDDRLRAREEDVYRAGVAWVRARDPPLGEAESAELLRRVRFARLPRAFLREVVLADPLFDTLACRNLLLEATLSATLPQRRSGETRLYAVAGCTPGTQLLSSVETYDPATNSWTLVTSVRARGWFGEGGARCEHAVAVLDGKLYVLGGSNGRDINLVESYDPYADVWQTMAPMRQVTTRRIAAVALRGKLYVVGGRSVERYDPATDEWEFPLMPWLMERSNVGVGGLDGKVYFVGGYMRGDDTYLNAVEQYDPAARLDPEPPWRPPNIDSDEELEPLPRRPRCERVAPMRTARACPGMAALDGKLYAVGGESWNHLPLRSAERYDPAANVWEKIAPMATARRSHCVAVLDGKLYAAGGDGDGAAKSVERYDPALNVWEALAPMVNGREHFGLAAL